MDPLAFVYAAYAAISLGLTIWLARILAKHGHTFLADVFKEKPELAEATNKLLVVGFFLANLGYASLTLSGGWATDPMRAIETLATKVGWLLVSLAFMHFMNMFIFYRIRRRAAARQNAAPIAPHGYVPPPALAPVQAQPCAS